jgi:hypothetical protein
MSSCSGTTDCDCGCCAGTSVQTPQPRSNAGGLPAVSYRVGTWSSFKESMLARLSSADYPALQALKTRSDDDFTIAFLDSTAMVLDILTFYQERLANESYLRTAGQLRSLTELSRLIGYQPAPGVSASAYLAFILKPTPGQPPNPSASPITIPAGTKVQSVPAQGQTPQTFETSTNILAKSDWTALPVQTGLAWTPQSGDLSVYLTGTATQLQPGDLILIVGDERIGLPTSPHWDIRVVASVTVDGQNNRTRVTWSEPLGSGSGTPAQSNPKFYAFRQRAALFGYNAVQPLMLDVGNLNAKLKNYMNADQTEWLFEISQDSKNTGLYLRGLVDLDSLYPKITPKGWIALIRPDQAVTRSPSGTISLYMVNSITAVARSDFGTSAKVSRVATDAPANSTELKPYYDDTRKTTALVQSEQLAVAEQPLTFPLYGTTISLETLRTDLAAVQFLAVSGKRQKIAVANAANLPKFYPNDNSNWRTLALGEILTLTGPPMPAPPAIPAAPPTALPVWNSAGNAPTLNVEDANGRPGTVSAHLEDFVLAPSSGSDPVVSEYALVKQVDSTSDPGHTQFQLQSALTYCYDRSSTTVNANVGLATHGQSVSEVLGSGNSSTPNQTFKLKQSPLSFVQSATPTGRASTLKVPVNGAAWREVSSLYHQSSSAAVYATLNQADGSAKLLFGDGVEGALLPTGQNNVQASYRAGSGSAGNVAAGALSTLMDRPLGVSGVTNPEAASGGQDPQSIGDIRTNAPQTVLTLGRAVSITDYQNFAATFAGISKAYALWIPNGPGRGVFLTIAGVGGAGVSQNAIATLVSSLHSFGNPLIPIAVQPYVESLFSFSANLVIDPNYDAPTVQAQAQQALSDALSFAARSFGQGVSIDEIAALIQGVPGVVASNVTGLTRGLSSQGGDLASLAGVSTTAKLNQWLAKQVTLNRPFTDPPNRLCAYLPVPNTQSLPQPAEILVMDPRPGVVVLGTMS